MKTHNFNLAIISLLLFLLTMKYMPKLIPSLKILEFISKSFMKRLGHIIIMTTVLFLVAVWFNLNDVDFKKMEEKKRKTIQIGTISV